MNTLLPLLLLAALAAAILRMRRTRTAAVQSRPDRAVDRRRHTAARADRVSTLMWRVLAVSAVLLAAIGQAALILHAALPAWTWAFILPDTLTVALHAFIRSLAPRTDPRIYGG